MNETELLKEIGLYTTITKNKEGYKDHLGNLVKNQESAKELYDACQNIKEMSGYDFLEPYYNICKETEKDLQKALDNYECAKQTLYHKVANIYHSTYNSKLPSTICGFRTKFFLEDR